MDKVSMSYLFPSQDIKQNELLSSSVDGIIYFKIYLQSTSDAMADRGKEGKMEIQKIEYLENEKSFLDEMKNIFHSFWRAIILCEIKI